MVINDLFPKATVHLLILLRDPSKNSLRAQEAFEDAEFLADCRAGYSCESHAKTLLVPETISLPKRVVTAGVRVCAKHLGSAKQGHSQIFTVPRDVVGSHERE